MKDQQIETDYKFTKNDADNKNVKIKLSLRAKRVSEGNLIQLEHLKYFSCILTS